MTARDADERSAAALARESSAGATRVRVAAQRASTRPTGPARVVLDMLGGAPRVSAQRTRPTLADVFAFLVLAIAGGYGALRLWTWAAAERGLFAPVPLAYLGVAALVALAAVASRARIHDVAMATIAWGLAIGVTAELPAFATADSAGQSASEAWLYVATALGSGLFAVRRSALSSAERSVCLLALWSTANLRMFWDEGAAPALFAAGVLLTIAVHGRGLSLRALLSGPGRVAVISALGLVSWFAIAAAAGDSLSIGVETVSILLSGVVLAWVVAAVLVAAGERRERATWCVVGGLFVGLALALGHLGLSLVDMLPHVGVERLLTWRLRLFGTHSNYSAPLFATLGALATPLVLRRTPPSDTGPRLERALLAPLLLACIVGLAWTHSRASAAAAVLGAVVALVCARGYVPSGARVAVVLSSAVVIAIAVLASPLGGRVAAALEARARGPSAVGQRYHFWKMSWQALAHEPWLGLGPNQYYAHARFAEPSFYEGTSQSLDPHNIVLAAGESAGFVGLVFMLVLALAFVEVGRRSVLAASVHERALFAGLFGATITVLCGNMFDLQSRATFVPLYLWLALGCALACVYARTIAHPSGVARPLGPLPALVLLVLLVVQVAMPLAGHALVDVGWLTLRRGDVQRSLAWYGAAELVDPVDPRAMRAQRIAHDTLGQRAEALAVRRAECRAAPSDARSWLRYGIELLEADREDGDRAKEALAACALARALDPYGPTRGDADFACAWAELELGHPQRARAALLSGLKYSGKMVTALPRTILPPEAGDGPRAKRFGFIIARDRARVLPFDEVLAELGREALEICRSDEVRAQRYLVDVIAAYRLQGLEERALTLVRAFNERAPVPMTSVQVREVELLCALGLFDEAWSAYSDSTSRADPYLTAAYLRGIRASDDPALARRFREVPLEIPVGPGRDLYFNRGLNGPIIDLAVERAQLAGDAGEAARLQRMALYDRTAPEVRVRTARSYFERSAELGLGDDALLDALRALLVEATRHPRLASQPAPLAEWARTAARAWRSDPQALRRAVADLADETGQTGARFRIELERELDLARHDAKD